MKHRKITTPTVAVFAILMVIQLFYPSARLLPGTTISGQNYSFMTKSEAITSLDRVYNDADIDIFFGENEKPYLTVKPIDIGLHVGNVQRVTVINYPLYMRIIPTSVFWYGFIQSDTPATLTFSDPNLDQFIDDKFGQDCNIEPVNASLQINGTNLNLVKASEGGTCKTKDVKEKIYNLDFINPSYASARVAMEAVAPDITNSDAQQLASAIGKKLLDPLSLSLGDEYGKVDLSPEELALWLEFEIVNNKIVVAINSEKSAKFFDERVAPIISQKAGVSIITTNNLTDITRQDGAEGKMINIKETNQRIADYLMDKRTSVDVAIQSIEPAIQYARSFDTTSAGISSFIKYFAQTHSGKFSVQLLEIGGQGRQASYYPDRQFMVAGASRFILGYGMLKATEQNNPSSNNGSDQSCFVSVMWRFETDCVSNAVYSLLRQDQDSLVLNNTALSSNPDNISSTAADLAKFLMRIHNGQILLSATDRDMLLDNLKTSEPRNGIASISSRIINATGSSYGQYSDVALLNSGISVYVLAILTENSKLSDVAELARQISDFMSR